MMIKVQQKSLLLKKEFISDLDALCASLHDNDLKRSSGDFNAGHYYRKKRMKDFSAENIPLKCFEG